MEKIFTRFGMKGLFILAGLTAATAQNDQVGLVYRDDLTGVEGVEVQCTACPQTSVWTNSDGLFTFEDLLPGTSYTFTPKKDGDDAVGVTVLDICLLRKHILGLDFISDPNRLRAADVNLSNSVSTFDLVLIARIILQMDPGFTLTDSWVFDPPHVEIDDLSGEPIGFLGIKMGDLLREEEAGIASVHTELSLPLVPATATGPVTAVVKVKEFTQIEGFQFGLAWDADVLQLDTVTTNLLPFFGAANFFRPGPGRLNVWWMSTDSQPLSLPDASDLLVLKFTVVNPSDPVQVKIAPEGTPLQILAEGCKLVDATLLSAVSDRAPVPGFRVVPAGNPSEPGQVTSFRVDSDRALGLQCLLTDVSGRTIQRWNKSISAGVTEMQLQAPALPGIYFLRLWAPGAGVQTLKWVVGG